VTTPTRQHISVFAKALSY